MDDSTMVENAAAAARSSYTGETEAVRVSQGEVFDGLAYVEECNRDIAKAVAELAERLCPVLRSSYPSPVSDGETDEVPDWSPLRERLAELNRAQHQILAHISDIGRRLGI